MSRQITFSVIADGGTDRILVPIIQWAIHHVDPTVEVLEPEFCKRYGPVVEFLDSYATGSRLVFVHRDAESESLQTRLAEFAKVTRSDVVPIVPVRMSEAWLLVNGQAIADAAGRPTAVVEMPPLARLESLADPKAHLETLLRDAAGNLAGRRLKQFTKDLTTRRVNVASLIGDFSPLLHLPAFAAFVAALKNAYPYPVLDN